jgi:pimeloyl-ACP methyl ester carboxylesterase
MYYESYGSGGVPLVLIHGAFSAIGTSFEKLIPGLSKNRQVIGFELQAHGRTVDIDRPMSMEAMADDVAAAIAQLGFERADVFGYSMGAGVAMRVAIQHPEVVRKLVLLSVASTFAGIHPGIMEGLGEMKPEMMHGSPWHDEYMRIAPRPEDFNRLFEKKGEMDKATTDLADADLRAINAPVLVIAGDSDLVTPEHAVEMFRLFGGGVFGDMMGMPRSQLAILPGTMHSNASARADLLVPIVTAFLDAPMAE